MRVRFRAAACVLSIPCRVPNVCMCILLVGAIVQTSYSAAAELAHNTAQGNFLFKKPPEEVLWERFKAVCTIIDQLAATENASAGERSRSAVHEKIVIKIHVLLTIKIHVLLTITILIS